MFNKVSYCKCDVESGNGISLTEKFDRSDVCSVNAGGQKDGYIVSMYSLPQSIVAPSGNQALYRCRGEFDRGLRPMRRRRLLYEHERWDVSRFYRAIGQQ